MMMETINQEIGTYETDAEGNQVVKTYDLNDLNDVVDLLKDSKGIIDKSGNSLKSLFTTLSKGLKDGDLKLGDLVE